MIRTCLTRLKHESDENEPTGVTVGGQDVDPETSLIPGGPVTHMFHGDKELTETVTLPTKTMMTDENEPTSMYPMVQSPMCFTVMRI